MTLRHLQRLSSLREKTEDTGRLVNDVIHKQLEELVRACTRLKSHAREIDSQESDERVRSRSSASNSRSRFARVASRASAKLDKVLVDVKLVESSQQMFVQRNCISLSSNSWRMVVSIFFTVSSPPIFSWGRGQFFFPSAGDDAGSIPSFLRNFLINFESR